MFQNDAKFVDPALGGEHPLQAEDGREAVLAVPSQEARVRGRNFGGIINNRNDEERRSLQASPLEFGPQPRIVNGQDAPKDRFSWFVRVLGDKNAGSPFGACGGSLIAPDVAITAAHCDFAARVLVDPYNLDEVNRNNNRNLMQIVPHPNYPQELTLEYDIMLVKFDAPITDLEPVMMNFDDSVPSETGEELLMLGFGSVIGGKETGQPDPPNEQSTILQQARTDYVSFDDCAVAEDEDLGFGYGTSPENTQVKDNWFCTIKTDPLTSTCFGDSGGPIIFEGSGPESDLLLAVISGASGYCGNPHLPLWNQRVSYHKDWIVEVGCQLSDMPPAYWNCGGTGGGSVPPEGDGDSTGNGNLDESGGGEGGGVNTVPTDEGGGGSTVPTEEGGGGSTVPTEEGGGGSTVPTEEGGGGGSTGMIIGIVAAVIVLVGFGFFIWKRRRGQKDAGPEKKLDGDSKYLDTQCGDIEQPYTDTGSSWLDKIKNATGANSGNKAEAESGEPTLMPFSAPGNDLPPDTSKLTDDSSGDDSVPGEAKRKSSWLPSRMSFLSNDIEEMVNKLDKELDDACKLDDKDDKPATNADRVRTLSRERAGAGDFADNDNRRGRSTSIERTKATTQADRRRSLSKDRSSATDHAAARGLFQECNGTNNHDNTRGRSKERTGASTHAGRRGSSKEPTGAGSHADTRGCSKEPAGASNHAGRRGSSKEPTRAGSHTDTRGRSKEPAGASNHAGRRGSSKEPTRAGSHTDTRGHSKEPAGASNHAGRRGSSKEPTGAGGHADTRGRSKERTGASNHAGRRGSSKEPTGAGAHADTRGHSKEPAGASDHAGRRGSSKEPTRAGSHANTRGRSKERTGASNHAGRRGSSKEPTGAGSHANTRGRSKEPAGASDHAGRRGSSKEPTGAGAHADTRGPSKERTGASNHAGRRGSSKEPTGAGSHANTRGRSREPAGASNYAVRRGSSKEPTGAGSHANTRGSSKDQSPATESTEFVLDENRGRSRSKQPSAQAPLTPSKSSDAENPLVKATKDLPAGSPKSDESKLAGKVAITRSNSFEASPTSKFVPKRANSFRATTASQFAEGKKAPPDRSKSTGARAAESISTTTKAPVDPSKPAGEPKCNNTMNTPSNSFKSALASKFADTKSRAPPARTQSADVANPLVKATMGLPTTLKSYRTPTQGFGDTAPDQTGIVNSDGSGVIEQKRTPPARTQSADIATPLVGTFKRLPPKSYRTPTQGSSNTTPNQKVTVNSSIMEQKRAPPARTQSADVANPLVRANMGLPATSKSYRTPFGDTAPDQTGIVNSNGSNVMEQKRAPPARTQSAGIAYPLVGDSKRLPPAPSKSYGTPTPGSSNTTPDQRVTVNSDGSSIVEQKRAPPARTQSADIASPLVGASKRLPPRSNSYMIPTQGFDDAPDRKVIVNPDGSVIVEQKRPREDGAFVTTRTKYANVFLARRHGVKV